MVKSIDPTRVKTLEIGHAKPWATTLKKLNNPKNFTKADSTFFHFASSRLKLMKSSHFGS